VAWDDLQPGFRTLAQRVCTHHQLAVLERVADGRNLSQIARDLGVTRQAIHGRWTAADHKLRREVNDLCRAE
jgi:DNA-binding NarL/FixJ family response regulator